MQPSVVRYLPLLLMLSVEGQADTLVVQQQPIIVYEGSSTLSAQPYYQRLKTKQAESGPALGSAPGGAGLLALEARLPLSPTQLTVGQPALQTVPGLVTPLFVMGMDAVSLTWFARAAQGLADIGARGLVVQADQLAPWKALQTQARDIGIDLMLLEGDSLAQGYGLTTYPTVLVSPALAQAGFRE